MGGQTDSKEVEFIITHQVGEVPSSVANGSPIEIEDPFSFYVKRLAKNHVDVPDHETPRDPDALIATASRAELVNTNIKPDTVQNICTIADAKIEAVEQNFTLSNETKNFAKGLKENLRALPIFFKNKDIFYSGPVSETPGLEQVDMIDSPDVSSGVKLAAKAGIVLELAANLAGCTPQNLTPSPEFTQEPTPIVEVIDTEIPGFIPKTETPTAIISTPSESVPSVDPTQTEKAPAVEVAPYPSSIKEFENGPTVLKGTEAEERIKALGAGDDLQALKDWYSSAGIPSSMMEAVIGESDIGAHWNLMIKYPDGKYGIITLTSGPEAGKIVRDGGLVSYLYSEVRPTFSFKELTNPSGYENVHQKVVADKNLWFAFSLEKDSQLLGWANLDIKQNAEWVDLQNLATSTSEAPAAETDLYKVMTAEEMKERNLFGYGIEFTAEVEGLDTTVYIVTSDKLAAKIAEYGYGPITLNPKLGEVTDMDSAERIAKTVRIADYEAYLQDKNMKEEDYTFTQYMQDLKDGKDRSYTVYYLDEKMVVDPTKPHEIIFAYDFDTVNGEVMNSGYYSQNGCRLTIDGGVRTINAVSVTAFKEIILPRFKYSSKEQDRWSIPLSMSGMLKKQLAYLAMSEMAQQGKSVGGDIHYIENNYNDLVKSQPTFSQINGMIMAEEIDKPDGNVVLWVDIVNE